MTDTTTTHTSQQPVYPLPTPADGDPRLTYSLLRHRRSVAAQRFPQPTGTDCAHLMTALDHFLYQPKENP